MRHYTKKSKSIESISINKIEQGIRSIKSGVRSGETVGKDLEFFFNKLEKCNNGMYNELYMKYCTARLEANKNLESIHS